MACNLPIPQQYIEQKRAGADAAPFRQDYINGQTRNSTQFLKDCTYEVDLLKLYKLKSTCYFNEQMEYCPVLVELTDEMKGFYGGANFLLQVWDSNAEKVYERCLKKEVLVWNIFFNFFAFKLQEPDQDSEYFQIINLAQGNAAILVTDFTQFDQKLKHDQQDPLDKYIAYENNILYVGTEDHIKILQVDEFLFPKNGECPAHLIHPDESEVSIIVMDKLFENNMFRNIKIHGFFINKEMSASVKDSSGQKNSESCILVALENYSNQIDLNSLHLLTKPGDENFNYELRQYRPVLPQQSSGFDQVIKFQLVIQNNGISTGAAVRQSGGIDFYYDGIQCLSKNPNFENEFKANDVEISFDETFVSTQYVGENTAIYDGPAIRGVSHDLLYTQSISQSRTLQDYNIKNVFYQRIKQHCKLFTGFVFLKTYIFVAHGNILSLYDILKEKFTNHIPFSDKINEVFRSLAKEHDDEDELEKHEFTVCVLLENGRLLFLTRRSGPDGEELYEEDPDMEQNVKGKIIQFDQDRDDNAWTFILVEMANGQFALQCLHDCELENITEYFTIEDNKQKGIQINKKTNFVFLYSPKKETEVLVHHEDMFIIYEIHYNHNPPEGEQKFSLVCKESRKNEWIDKSLPEKDQAPQIFVEENDGIHSGIRVDDYGTMILADHTYFYVINMARNDIPPTRYKQMCSGLFLSDGNYMYTLSHKNPDTKTESGFRLFDIRNCISQVRNWSIESKNKDNNGSSDGSAQQKSPKIKELMSYLLQSIQVGCQTMIDFSHQNQRLVYQSSYNKIDVVPVLHRNTISFVGMNDREDYLATRVIDDKFIALSKKNILTTWSITTGKLISEKNLDENQDFSKWDVYQYNRKTHIAYKQDWPQHVLIVSTEDTGKPVDDNLFYDNKMISTQMKNQETFIKKLPKQLKLFKLIEIVNESKVVEHFSYEFPFYYGAEQHMYFSNDKTMMFERLINGRCFMYRRGEIDQWSGKVMWNQIRRFSQFPADLLAATQYPYIFSPDFSMYLDIDRKAQVFLIKDTFTQKTRKTIPVHVMNCRIESYVSVAARCKWLDNNTLKYVNREGIERKIDVASNNFQEIQFNVISLFDDLYKEHLESSKHHYFEKLAFENTETLKRLQHKYQQYKSAFYLEDPQDDLSLYRNLFTVDYTLDNYLGRYVVDLSFSYLHWNLMEKLETGKIQVAQIDEEQFEKLIYNILPGGDTVLHRLARDTKGNVITEIFKHCHPNPEKLDIPPCVKHVPFLQNFSYKRETPVTLLLEKDDYRTVNNILLYLAAYGLDHHSRALAESLPQCVPGPSPQGGSKGCQNLVLYLASRLQQTEECQRLTKGNLNEERELPGVIASKFLMSNEDNELLQKQEPPVEGEEEQAAAPLSDLKFQFFDVAQLHEFNNEFAQKFFEQLSKTDNMAIFDNKGVQMLIEFRWQLVKMFVKQKMFYPFIAYLVSFSFFMSTIYEMREDKDETNQLIYLIFLGILGTQSVYFLSRELYQMVKKGVSYFGDIWNYFDLIPPLLLIIFLPLAYMGYFDSVNGVRQNQTAEASLQATCSLLLWLKLLYFLRIYQSTGYLIRMIISVCVDMRYFLFILFLTIMAFGDALRAISTSNLPQNQFIVYWWQSFAYVYRMILGDFSTDPTVLQGGPVIQEGYSDPNTGLGKIAPYFAMGLFYMCTVLNMIIMLNLLIAIISESFARINQQKEQANYQELCDIIAENTYLVPESTQRGFCERNRYLLIATDIQQEMDNMPTDTNSMLRDTYNKISVANTEMEKRVIQQIEFLKSENSRLIKEKLDALEEENKETLEELLCVLDPRRRQEDN